MRGKIKLKYIIIVLIIILVIVYLPSFFINSTTNSKYVGACGYHFINIPSSENNKKCIPPLICSQSLPDVGGTCTITPFGI